MNIGVMQLSNVNVATKTTNSSQSTSNGNSFGEIFSQMATENSEISSNPGELLDDTNQLEQLDALLSSTSIVDVFNLLDISHDEGLFAINSNGQALSIDELTNMDDLLEVLNIEKEDVIGVIQELFGQSEKDLNDIWDLIDSVNEQGPKFISEIMSALGGESNVTPKAAEQFLQFLKVTQMVGGKSDLLSDQQNQLHKLNELLQLVSNEVAGKVTDTKMANDNISSKSLTANFNSTVQNNNETSTSNLLFKNVVYGTKLLNKQTKDQQQKSVTVENRLSDGVNVKQTLTTIPTTLDNRILTTTTEKVTTENFTQVVQQVVKGTETVEQTQIVASGQNSTVNNQTVTITLPVEKPAQSEAFVKEIQNLLNRSQISNSQGTMKLLVKLYPENLGSIRIEVLQKDGVLSARLLASTPQGKELLDSQIQQLKTAFAQQNIQMDRIDIAQSLQETDRNNRDQNLFGNLFNQQQSEQEEEQQEDSEQEESLSFSELLLNEEV